MALSVRELFLVVRAQNQASGTLNRVSRDMENLSRTGEFAFARASHAIGGLGRTMQFTGGVVAATLGFAANSAAEFDSKMQLVGTQTGKSFEDIQRTVDRIMPAVLKQMGQFPASADDMSTALYDIFSSLDVNVKGGINLLQTMNKAAVGGQVDLATVTDATISVMNDYGTSVNGVNDVMNTMFAAVRFGRMTFGEFANSLGQTVAPLSAAGQSFDILSGTMAFLTRKIPSTAKASVALSRAVETLGREKFITGVRQAGVELTNLHGKLLPLPEIVDRLTKKFPQLTKGGTFLQQFLKDMSGTEGTIQARRALTFLFQDVSGYHKILGQVIDDNKEFGRSSKALGQSAGVQWKTFLNTLQALWITLGQAVIPAFVELSKPLKELVKWIQQLGKEQRENIGRWLVFISVGAVVAGTFLSITAAILGLAALLPLIGSNLLLFATVGTVFAAMAAGAYLVMKNWKEVRPFIEKYWPSVLQKMKSVFEAVKPIVERFVSIIEDAVALIASIISGDWGNAWDNFKNIVTDAAGLVKFTMAALSQAVSAYLSAMTHSIQGFIAGAAGLGLIMRTLAGGPAGGLLGGGRRGLMGGGSIAALGEEGALFAGSGMLTTFKRNWMKKVSLPISKFIQQDQTRRLEAVGKKISVSKAGNLMMDAKTLRLYEQGGIKAAAGITKLNTAIAVGSGIIGAVPLTWWAAGAAIAAIGVYALVTATKMDKLADETKKIGQLKESFAAVGAASGNFNALSQQVGVYKQAISDTKKQLADAKGGTDEYRAALDLLAQQQGGLTDATNRAASAQDTLNAAVQTTIDTLKNFDLSASVAAINAAASQTTAPGGVTGAPAQNLKAYVQSRGDQGKQNLADTNKLFKDQVLIFAEAIASGRKLTATEKLLYDQMGLLADKAAAMGQPAMANIFNGLNANAQTLLGTLGRVPQDLAGFGVWADSISGRLMPAMQAFVGITHQLPSMDFSMLLDRLSQKSSKLATEMATFVATLGHMPSKKEINLYFRRPGYIQKFVTDFLRKFGHLPSKKEIDIEIDKHHKAEARLNKLEHHIDRIQAKRSAFAEAHGAITRTDPLAGSLDKAQRKLNQMKGPHLKGILQFTLRPKDAFTAIPRSAKRAAGDAKQQFSSLPKALRGFGEESGGAFARGFTATASTNAKVTVSVMINEFKKTIQAGSPSKRFKKEVGDPILQGILEGLKNKADIKSAADTAVDTMISVFNDKKSMFQDQFGELFDTQNITDKVDWGEKLNIQDLTKSLGQQAHKFRRFQRELRQLDRRKGTSPAFIAMMQQLGPESQAELDALLRATPKQLRRYVRMWEHSQKFITKTAEKATKAQYRLWRQQGAAVALGFLQGMQDHSAAMARWIRRLFMGLLNHVRHTHKSHSPSKVYYQEGLNVAMGFRLGMADGMRGATLSAPRVKGILRSRVRDEHTHYHIHPGANTSQLGALKRQEYLRRRKK